MELASRLGAIYLLGRAILLARLVVGPRLARRLIRRATIRQGRLTSGSCAVPARALLCRGASGKPGPIAVGGLVLAAHLLKHVAPIDPFELRQQGIEGAVRIRAQISREGVPSKVHVLNEDEVDPRFTQAAVESVRQWRYEPAKLDGAPVKVTATIAVEFHLGR